MMGPQKTGMTAKAAALALLAGLATVSAAPVTETKSVLTVSGLPRPSVVVAEAGAQAQARTLVTLLGRITGQTPPLSVGMAPATEDAVVIHVGRTEYVESLGLNLDALHPAGYRLLMPDASHLVLAGRRPLGTGYAVYDFMKRFGGYRHFMPGALGEVTPRRDTLALPPRLDVREEPSFVTYNNAGMYGGNAAFSRSSHVAQYATHWFMHIFPPATYGKAHPEYYPMIDGKRFVPPDTLEGTWQPCVSNPDLPAIAMAYARDYFAKNPDKLSVPMGVNDGLGDCQCPGCLGLQKKYANPYIPFYNAVAKLLRQEFPDKTVAFIAYGGAREVPRGIRLEPGIHVEITNGARDGLAAMRAWREAGATSLGLYDYLYGGGYVVPRHYPHVMADAWRKAYKALGLRGGWFETFTQVWLYDGPRQYVLNELAWDIDADVDELLEDYFTSFYGAGGKAVRQFFNRHEDVYRRRADPLHPMSDWHSPEQMKDYTHADLAYLRGRLDTAEAALAREPDSAPAARLALLRKVYGLTERMIGAEIIVNELGAVGRVRGRRAARRLVERMETGFRLQAEIAEYAMTEAEERDLFTRTGLQAFRAQPELQSGQRLEAQADRLLALATAAIEAEEGWPAAREFCFDTARNALTPAFRAVALTPVYSREAADAKVNLVANGGCEPPDAAADARAGVEANGQQAFKAPGWNTWHFQQTVTRFMHDASDPHGGGHSFAIGENNYSGSFMQGVRVQPGCRYRLAFWVKQSPAGRGGAASVRWQGKSGWLDVEGKSPRISVPYPRASETAWREISATFTAPADATAPAERVSALLLLGAPSGQTAGERIWFDDVSLTKIFDPAAQLPPTLTVK